MEHVSREADVGDTVVGQLIRAASPECPSAPEDLDGTWASSQPHCRDSWMLGNLILKLLSRFSGKPDGELQRFKQSVKKSYCSADPRKRPAIESLLNNQYFKVYPQFALIHSVDFLESITVKTDEEKKAFFRKASSDLFQVTSDLFQKYLIRLMFSDLIFADENAREYLLPRLLTVKTKRESRGFYKAESYIKIMGPLLKELFKRRAKHTRLVLLRMARWYVPYLPTHFVKDSLLPEILVGLNDTDDAIVMATFNTLAVLTSFLGSKTVVGSSLTKSHFHDAFPRGLDGHHLEVPDSPSDPGITDTAFSQGMNGQIMNESDLDSGKEYTMAHISQEEEIKNEREKRAHEFKKRREAKKRKDEELKQVKLIEVASRPGPSNETQGLVGTSELTSHEILKKERFSHREKLVIEQQGFSMEYKGSPEDTANWDDSANDLDLSHLSDCRVSEEDEPAQSLLELAQGSDLGADTPTNILDGEEALAPATIPLNTSPPAPASAGVSQWESGGWSDFDSQFESDEGVEMQSVGEVLRPETIPETIPEMAEAVPEGHVTRVSDIMNLERAVQPIQDFFADMQPSYTSPKLL